MATQRISFCRFVPREHFYLDLVVSNLLSENSETNYFVFDEQGNEYVSGSYLVQQPRNEMSYNVRENKFETVVTTKLSILKFEIDLPNCILTIWGNRNIAQRLITLISQACNNQVVIDNYEVNFKQVLSKLSSMTDVTLSKMKLENVIIESGISASCIINIRNIDNPKDLIKKYIDNISQISIIIGQNFSDDESVSLTFFSSGSIVLYKDRDDTSEETIAKIKSISIK